MKTIHFVILFLLLSLIGYSQELPPVVNYEPSVYEAGNQNWMIAQDKKGTIYSANNSGLVEFNGTHWNLYKTPNESIMRSVTVAGDRVYTGCYRDFGYWEINNKGKLYYTSLVEFTGLTLAEDEEFWKIIVNDDYALFQSLSHIYSFDFKTNQIGIVVENTAINKFFEVDREYYYQELGKGLFKVVNKKSQLINSSPQIIDEIIVEMFEKDNQTFLITENGNILILTDNELNKLSQVKLDDGLAIYSAQLLSDDTIAIGTIANGLLNIDFDGSINYSINQRLGLLNNTILSLFEDATGNIWTGLDNGLGCVNNKSPYKIYSDRSGSLGTIYAAYRLDDKLYLGSNQGLFVRKDGESFKFISGTQGQVWDLTYEFGSLFCSHNNGLFVIKDEQVVRVDRLKGVWKVEPIPGRDDYLVAGTYKGLFLLKRENRNWVAKQRLSGFNISSKDFAFDDSLNLYVNHEYKGVYKLDLNDSLTEITNVQKLNYLPKGIGSCIAYYNGDMLYAKRNELFVKKNDSDKFIRDQELSKILEAESYTSGTLIVENDLLWMFNKEGVVNISYENINGSYNIKNIPLKQELRKEKVGYELISHVEGDTYILGTSYGYTLLNKSASTRTTQKITITQVENRINDSIYNHDLSGKPSIPFNSNNLSIYYTVPSYSALDRVEYRYRVNDGINEWSQWNNSGVTQLKNLSYGDYEIEIQGRSNGEIIEDTATISFTVERPGYLSNIAIFLYVISLLLLVGLLNGFYVWYFKRQKRLALEKQEKELELKNLANEKRLIELRNEKLRNDIELRNKELAVSTMAMIKKNETLNELKEELNKLPKGEDAQSLRKLLDKNLNSKKDWISFEEAFNNADKDFFKKIKERHPNLTSGDLRLCVYLRLNLSSKEIAPLLNISPRSVEIKRYRLRKKLNLDRNSSLSGYIVDI